MAGPRSASPAKSIERDGIRVEVLASDEMRVEQVRLSQAAPQSSDAEEVRHEQT